MANALTGVRLLLVLPVAVAFARPDLLDPNLALLLLAAAIASDVLDGRVARITGTASPKGQLFDHGTDCLFVTAGLAGAALSGLVTPLLPVLVPIAFTQYVVDSYVLARRPRLRMSAVGRWNGILYFLPLVLIAVSRVRPAGDAASLLTRTAAAAAYLLVASTVLSIVDRAAASLRSS